MMRNGFSVVMERLRAVDFSGRKISPFDSPTPLKGCHLNSYSQMTHA
jgi:hypothetical protein